MSERGMRFVVFVLRVVGIIEVAFIFFRIPVIFTVEDVERFANC